MKRRGWSIRNMIRVKRLMKAVPEAMRGELIVALNLGGRALQAAMRARAPFKTGLVRSAIVFKVFPKTLRLRVGFLGRKRGRSDVFYGRIQDLGRKAQTVTVTRHLQALRQVGNNRNGNTRRTIYSGRPYKMRVRGMPAKRFITGRFPDLRQAINRELKGIWDRALKAIGRVPAMTSPTDPFSAIDVATYAALTAGIVGAKVYQHVPANAALPVVIIGDMDEARKLSGKGKGAGREVPLSIVTVTEGEERAACARIQYQVEQILDGAALVAGAFTIRPIFEGASCVLAEDGLGYIGLSQFKVFALA